MVLTFNLPLGTTRHVKVDVDPCSTISDPIPPLLRFSVRMGSSQYADLANHQGRVQIWSNFRAPGSWSELDFQYPKEMPTTSFDCMNLCGPTGLKAAHETLEAYVTVPHGRKYFSLTYRIVHASGDIEWLGAFGNNCSVTIERCPEGYISLEGDWVADANLSKTRQIIGEFSALKIAQINNPATFIVQTVEADSDRPSSAILLVPRISAHTILVPPTYIIAAGIGTAISVSPTGAVHLSGRDAEVTIRSFPAARTPDPYLLDAAGDFVAAGYRALAADPDGTLVVASPMDAMPVRAFVLPPLPAKSVHASLVSLDADTLADMLWGLMDGPSACMLYAPVTRVARVYPNPVRNTTYHLLVPPEGGVLMAAQSCQFEPKAFISIITTHTVISPSPAANTPLPFAQPHFLSTADAEIPTLGDAVHEATEHPAHLPLRPDSETALSQELRGVGTPGVGERVAETVTESPVTPPESDKEPRNIFARWINTISNAIRWLFSILFSPFFDSDKGGKDVVYGGAIPPSPTNIAGAQEHDNVNQADATEVAVHIAPAAAIVDERTPLLRPTGLSQPVAEPSDVLPDHAATSRTGLLDSNTSHFSEELANIKRHSPAKADTEDGGCPPVLHVVVPAGTVQIIVHGYPATTQLRDRIFCRLDGERLAPRSVTPLDGCNQLLEYDAGRGGRLRLDCDSKGE
ncbi:hypothetical protein FISHEDRAFT_62189 [Fistulina hepatica ATCC 64428]|nr:hypothetical protein FISHEDRAFT_62189 [Fistulina hepatica ATCC 64428]